MACVSVLLSGGGVMIDAGFGYSTVNGALNRAGFGQFAM